MAECPYCEYYNDTTTGDPFCEHLLALCFDDAELCMDRDVAICMHDDLPIQSDDFTPLQDSVTALAQGVARLGIAAVEVNRDESEVLGDFVRQVLEEWDAWDVPPPPPESEGSLDKWAAAHYSTPAESFEALWKRLVDTDPAAVVVREDTIESGPGCTWLRQEYYTASALETAKRIQAGILDLAGDVRRMASELR